MGCAQEAGYADSLQEELAATRNPSLKSRISLQLSAWYERRDVEKSRTWARRALRNASDSVQGEALNLLGRSFFYQNLPDSALGYFNRSLEAFQKGVLLDKAASVQISLGAVQLRQGHYQKALTAFFGGLEYFETTEDSLQLGKCYNNIASAYGELGESEKAISYGEKALDIFEQTGTTAYALVTLPNLAGSYARLGDTTAARRSLHKAKRLAVTRKDSFSLARIYNNLGNLYLETAPDSAGHYLRRSLAIKRATQMDDGIGTLYNNLGYLSLQRNEPGQALEFFEQALRDSRGTNLWTIHANRSEAYQQAGRFREALDALRKGMAVKDSLMDAEHRKSLAEISSRYESEKVAREMLVLQNELLQADLRRRRNRNLLYLALGVLLFSGVLVAFYLKNTNKKRIIAEQQQELDRQRVESLLSDLETVGFESMMEGQEKERQRIAEELHDSLGANLAALKLFIEDIRKSEPDLHKKLKQVLDQSYEGLRAIAYGKNTYAMIEKGLLPAVNMIAEQLKSTQKIDVQVTNIDLHQKIQNFKEVQLFRIIQELLTNTIKHADARNVSIQFAADDGALSVVYEDDGRGFDPEQVTPGQGLVNIRNRVAKVGGTMVLESRPGDGINVIIKVPL